MKGKLFLLQILLYICIIKMCGGSNENAKSKKFIPYFRQQVEEMEDNNLSEKTEKDEPPNHLVSFLVNNVKEIFDDIIETTEEADIALESTMRIMATTSLLTNSSAIFRSITISSTEVSSASRTTDYINPTPSTNVTSTPSIIISSTLSTPIDSTSPYFKTSVSSICTTSVHTNLTDRIFENLTLTTLLDKKNVKQKELVQKKSVDKTNKLEHEIEVETQLSNVNSDTANTSDSLSEHDARRSCIMCNNVAVEDCYDPKNKLIQSVMCERNDDLCYSMHTPFGIIDRGCYNANHNLTTYVCSCNLCNYISISEMPYTFNNNKDWIDNVIEISRTRHFRKSIFKDMSCLRCEVNSTVEKADLVQSANCLEGSIGNIPVEECEENEVCAVRAHRADGYIWRGCVRAPLYNYWWQFCDYDLCNYDSVISLYDFV